VGEIGSKAPKQLRGKGKPFTGKDDPRINRAGRKPAGESMAEKLRAYLERVDPATGVSANDEFADYLRQIAAVGTRQSVEAIKLLWERAYGKPMQAVEMSGPGGAALGITYSGGIVPPKVEVGP